MSVVKEIQVTVRVNEADKFRLKDKVAMLESFSKLPIEDQQRMTKIMKNPKALKGIADNEAMLESMFS
jgi:hypothetical protein